MGGSPVRPVEPVTVGYSCKRDTRRDLVEMILHKSHLSCKQLLLLLLLFIYL